MADAALYYGKTNGRNRWVMVNNLSLDSASELDVLLKAPLSETTENKNCLWRQINTLRSESRKATEAVLAVSQNIFS